jgi:hypothetical protein
VNTSTVGPGRVIPSESRRKEVPITSALIARRSRVQGLFIV